MYKAKHGKPSRAWRWLYPPVSLLLAIALLTATFAWIFKSRQQEAYTGASNFNIAGQAYFMKGDTRIPTDGFFKGGLLYLNITDPDADNYLGNFRFDVSFTGFSPAYIRVRVLEQWMDEQTETLQAVSFVPYTLPDGGMWYDNRQEDLYYYHTALVSSHDTASPEATVIPLITGVEPAFLETIREGAAALYLTISVEAVQPNRYSQFWNIDTLPWETSSQAGA